MNDDDLNRYAEHEDQRDMARSQGCFWLLVGLAVVCLLACISIAWGWF